MKTTTQPESFTLTVNKRNITRDLGSIFTDKYTLIKELLQNSRRANASHIAIRYNSELSELVINDNGEGIKSNQAKLLFDVASSGWRTQTIDNEKPFGIGFMSAVYMCDNIEITSLDWKLSVNTKDVLEYQPIELHCANELKQGTTIRLSGLKESFDLSKIKNLVFGFPISISVNGDLIERPHALDSDRKFNGCYFGMLSLVVNDEYSTLSTKDYIVYYQGFEILRSDKMRKNYEREIAHVFHLNDVKYRDQVRLPDRDCLKNEFEHSQQIFQYLKSEQRGRFFAVGLRDQGYTLAHYLSKTISYWKYKDIYLEFDYLPASDFIIIDQTPTLSNNEEGVGYTTSNPNKPVKISDILDGNVNVFENTGFTCLYENENTEKDFNKAMYLYKTEHYILNASSIYRDHPISVVAASNSKLLDDISVYIDNVRLPKVGQEFYCWAEQVILCEKITLSCSLGAVEFIDESMILRVGNVDIFAVTDGCLDSSGLLLAESFQEEFYYNETQQHISEDNFCNWHTMELLACNPEKLLMKILKDNESLTAPIEGKFTIDFCSDEPVVEAA